MKVFSKKLRNLIPNVSPQSPFLAHSRAQFSVSAPFIARWNNIQREAEMGGGTKRMEKQHA